MIYVKTNKEIDGIKKAASVWKAVKQIIEKNVMIGISTNELDEIAGNEIANHGAIPTFLNYNNFPKNICISINEELIHGIPSNRKLKDKDMITFDVGVTLNGYVCDSAFTVILGKNDEAKKISDATYKSLMETIKIVKPDVAIGTLGNKTEEVAKSCGYEVIKDFSGHGCGRQLHEGPNIFNYGKINEGAKLVAGMTICIEPMLLTETDKYTTLDNNWTIVSKNKKLTCHWEHMVLVTSEGNEILTI
ncbi:MAG: type I methionyl aminopeptidase [Mycoplasmoidaceae bacterium]|nr:MAG: type I methionyl aminopeptidase [Mycoplasmoidaceae bacterium]